MTGRLVLVALGAVGALLGLLLAGGGLVLLLLTGRGGFGGGAGPLTTDSYALVSDAAGLRAGGVDASVRVRVRSEGGPVFVGVGPTAAVTEFLAGVDYAELTAVRLSPLRATQVPSGGTKAPVRPGDRTLWTVSATGPGEQTIDVEVGTVGQELVVMNADGSAGVSVTASLALQVDFLRRLALGLLVAGAVVAPVGGVLLATGVRRTAAARSG